MRKKVLLVAIFFTMFLKLVVGVTYEYLMNYVPWQEKNIIENKIERITKVESFGHDLYQAEKLKITNKNYYIYYSKTKNKNIMEHFRDRMKVMLKVVIDSRSRTVSYAVDETNDKFVKREIVKNKYVWNKHPKLLDYLLEIKKLSEILVPEYIINVKTDLIVLNRTLKEQILRAHFDGKYIIEQEGDDRIRDSISK